MSFAVGEIALAYAWTYAPQWENAEVLVVGRAEMREGFFAHTQQPYTQFSYLVETPDGQLWTPTPCALRKKPPREELGDWELIPWSRPVKERVT